MLYQLADKWLDAFAKWPPMNQLAYSAVILLAGLVLTAILAYMVYLFVYYATVAVRGWPEEPGRPTWADIAYLNRQMEAYRTWEKQRLLQTKSVPSTPRSSPSSKTADHSDVPQPTRPAPTSAPACTTGSPGSRSGG